MKRQGGFSLVELMAVVALTGVLASLAILAMRKSRTQGDVDKFASMVRATMLQARRRATATRFPYMVHMQASSVRWCRVAYVASPLSTTQTTCPPANATLETGPLMRAGVDAHAIKYAESADVVMPNMAYTAPAKIDLPKAFYFGPNGTIDEDFATAMLGFGTPLAGVTVYIEPISAITAANDAKFRRRRVITYGVSARPRIIDNW